MKENRIVADALHIIKSAKISQRLDVGGSAAVGGNMKVSGWLDAPNLRGMCVGLFADEDALNSAYPRPRPGMYALVGDTVPAAVWRADKGEWTATGETGGDSTVDFSDYESLKETVATLEMENVKRISVEDFNAFPVDTAAIKSSMQWPSRWQITLSEGSLYVIAICDVFFDSLAHTIIETLTTQHVITDEALDSSEHADGIVCTYMRAYNISSGALSNDVGTWTEWKLISTTALGVAEDEASDDDDTTTTTIDTATLLTVVGKYASLATALEVNTEAITSIQGTLDGLVALSTDEITSLCAFDD